MKKFKIQLKRLFCKALVMCRLKKQPKFFFEPFIYIIEDGSIYKLGISNRVKWLEKFSVKAFIQEDADVEAWKIVNEKYPDWKGYVQFF